MLACAQENQSGATRATMTSLAAMTKAHLSVNITERGKREKKKERMKEREKESERERETK